MILTHLVLFSFFNGAGGTAVPPTPTGPLYDQTPIPGAGHGKRKDWKALQAKEVLRLLEDLGEAPETAVVAAKVVAEHAKPAKKNAAPRIDIAALMADIQAVQWILDAHHALEERRRIEFLRRQDDEDAFMLLM